MRHARYRTIGLMQIGPHRGGDWLWWRQGNEIFAAGEQTGGGAGIRACTKDGRPRRRTVGANFGLIRYSDQLPKLDVRRTCGKRRCDAMRADAIRCMHITCWTTAKQASAVVVVSVGCWLLAVGCGLLAVGSWLLALGSWLILAQWMLSQLADEIDHYDGTSGHSRRQGPYIRCLGALSNTVLLGGAVLDSPPYRVQYSTNLRTPTGEIQ